MERGPQTQLRADLWGPGLGRGPTTPTPIAQQGQRPTLRARLSRPLFVDTAGYSGMALSIFIRVHPLSLRSGNPAINRTTSIKRRLFINNEVYCN